MEQGDTFGKLGTGAPGAGDAAEHSYKLPQYVRWSVCVTVPQPTRPPRSSTTVSLDLRLTFGSPIIIDSATTLPDIQSHSL